MNKYVFLYNVDDKAERTQESMDAWMAWFKSMGEKVVDVGNPLENGRQIVGGTVTDITPEMGTTSGYSIVNAADMDAALAIAEGCPDKAGVRVYEAAPM